MARDAENELLRQEITLLKAQQEEANAQHADEIKRRDSHAEQRERRIAELEAKQQACQEFFHTVRTVSMSDFIVDNKLEGLSKRTAHLSPHTASIVEQRFRVTAASADALVLAVAKVQQDLLDICNLYRE
jgi:LPS sulfotransferase NodH